MSEKSKSACPYCQSEPVTTYRGWNVVVAICGSCGKTYTYPLDSDAHRLAQTPADTTMVRWLSDGTADR